MVTQILSLRKVFEKPVSGRPMSAAAGRINDEKYRKMIQVVLTRDSLTVGEIIFPSIASPNGKHDVNVLSISNLNSSPKIRCVVDDDVTFRELEIAAQDIQRDLSQNRTIGQTTGFQWMVV